MRWIDTGAARLRRLALAAVLPWALGSAAQVAQAAQVQQFTPQGRVDQQSRAVARFNADVVKLGDTGAAAP